MPIICLPSAAYCSSVLKDSRDAIYAKFEFLLFEFKYIFLFFFKLACSFSDICGLQEIFYFLNTFSEFSLKCCSGLEFEAITEEITDEHNLTWMDWTNLESNIWIRSKLGSVQTFRTHLERRSLFDLMFKLEILPTPPTFGS